MIKRNVFLVSNVLMDSAKELTIILFGLVQKIILVCVITKDKKRHFKDILMKKWSV